MKDSFTIQFKEWMVVSERTMERATHESLWICQFTVEIHLIQLKLYNNGEVNATKLRILLIREFEILSIKLKTFILL